VDGRPAVPASEQDVGRTGFYVFANERVQSDDRRMTGTADAWLDTVLSPSDHRRNDTDWIEWFRHVFQHQGGLDAGKLDRVALAEQKDRAAKACTLVAADVLATTGRAVTAAPFVDEWDVGQFVVRLRVDDEVVNGNGLDAIGVGELAVEVADAIQEEVMDDRLVWPECPLHNTGLHPELHGGQAESTTASGPRAAGYQG
jgi:hypothetical protein